MTSDSYRWRPIEDLPEDHSALADPQLPYLAQIWLNEKKRLSQTPAIIEFEEQLVRELAIETGVIERIYDLDRGVTEILIRRGFDEQLIPHWASNRPAAEVVEILQDQQQAVEGVFDFVKGARELTTSYIKEIHAQITRHQPTVTLKDRTGRLVETPLRRGEYKLQPNNPLRPNGSVHEYCPPEQVAPEMERLVQLFRQHQSQSIPPEVEASWLHHRFTQIHPFQDGNGRVARVLAALVLVKAGWLPLNIDRDDRASYIDALERADRGDFAAFVTFSSAIIRRTFLAAMSAAAASIYVGEGQSAAEALIKTLDTKKQFLPQRQQARALAVALLQIAEARLNELCSELSRNMANRLDGFECAVPASTPSEHTEASVLKATQINLKHASFDSSILVVFNEPPGAGNFGIILCSVAYKSRDSVLTPAAGPGSGRPRSSEPFLINYLEPAELAAARFRPWLENQLTLALDTWRRSL